MNCDQPWRRLGRLLNPDRQDLHNTCRAPQLTGNSVLPTELDVFGFLDLSRGGDTAKLSNEELSRGFPEARRGEHPGLETADRMRRGQQVPADLEVVDLDSIGPRQLQDLSPSSEVRRTSDDHLRGAHR